MRSLYLIIFLFLFSSLRADHFKVEKVEPENGFPSHLIYKIYQDSKGFIWYGTMYGLYRYDGINYTSYRYDPFDSTSIGNDDIISIFEDSKGFLWFGTYLGGVSKYDATTSSFKRFVHSDDKNSICDNTVWAITEDRTGTIWFATQSGLCNFSGNSFSTIDIPGYDKGMIFSLAADKENNLWFGTPGKGLFRLDRERKKFDRFKRNDTAPDSINGNAVRGLFCDSKGDIWAGMIQRGVCMIKADDLKNGNYRFNKQQFDSTNENSPGNKTVYDICEDRKGSIFISSANSVYKSDNNSFSKIDLGTANKYESVAMLCDMTGCLWLSSYENCLYKIINSGNSFSNYSQSSDGKLLGNVKALISYKEKILIGSDRGLFEFDPVGKLISIFKTSSTVRSVNSLIKDNSGNIYISTDSGIVVISENNSEKRIIPGIPVIKVIISMGNIIAGTMQGIYFIDQITSDTVHYTHIPDDMNSLNDNAILSLYNDAANNLWAGTYAGLNKFDPAEKSFIHYSKSLGDTNTLSNNYIYSIVQKNENELYLGTAGGLNVFNFKENKFTLIKENILSNSFISSVLPLKNNLWIGTNRGLVRFDSASRNIKNYGKVEGIDGIIFNPDALITSSDLIFAGSRTGFVIFDPVELHYENTKPLIEYTSLKIYSEGKNISKDISSMSKIDLDHSQNSLNIEFALMDFTETGKNQYEYMLLGSDKGWINSGSKNSVLYSGLNPGSYELRVRGINFNGIKSDERALLFVIHPPFWKTIWFYLVITLLIISIIFLFYRYKLRKNVQLALQIEHAKEEEREKWREQASIDYHDELGHKLTRISMYSRRVLKKLNGSADEFGDDINNIIETSNSLRMSARDLIWSLNPSEDSLFDFITRINLFADELAESSGAQYHKCESKSEWKEIDLPMVTKRQMLFILKEAMNNSVKHSNAKNIRFKAVLIDENLTFEISDDGKGFNYPSEYSGYGLLNMKKRASKTGFDLDIISSPKNGTKIIINNILITSPNIKNN